MRRAGEFWRDRIPVVSHALDIPARLKELDPNYVVMFNAATQKYEIHYGESGWSTLECVLPYDELDERAIRHVREHRIERMEAIVREMEEHNRRIEEEAYRSMMDKAEQQTKEAMKYLRNNSKTDEIPKELMDG